MVRPEGEDDPRMRKGISAWAALEADFAWALAASANGQVFIETDVRAHANPTRMDHIRLVTEDLVKELCSLCPTCERAGILDRRARGWAPVRRLRRAHARDPCRDSWMPQVRASPHPRVH